MKRAARYATTLLLLSCLLTRGVAADDASVERILNKAVPAGPDDLRVIEGRARELGKKAIAATVALFIGGGVQGSGVIVSEDGYVLTASHVVGRPGRPVQFRLPDGTAFDGVSLGMHATSDLALAKITEEGDWPFVEMIPAGEGPRAGDWCLVTGHAGGFQEDRAPPLRFGRILDVREDVIRTDCTIVSGDSGGPLFDMQGRVIGINSRIAGDMTFNLHGPALVAVEHWDQLVEKAILPDQPPSLFLAEFDTNEDGSLSRDELPEDGLRRQVLDGILEKYELDADESHAIGDVAKLFGWRDSGRIPDTGRPYEAEDRLTQTLLPKLFVRGSAVRESFDSVSTDVATSVVRVERNGRQIALGTVVHPDGWVLTKASELDGTIKCKVGRKRFAAEVVDVHKELDLAMLRIEADDLTSVEWSPTAELTEGSWLVTRGLKGVETVGVVSVPGRTIVPVPGVLGVQIAPRNDEARVVMVFDPSGAAAAGVQEGDEITHVNDKRVHNIDELRASLRDFRARDVVIVTVERDEDQELKLEVTLGSPQDVFFPVTREMTGPLSSRRDGFPVAIQHDSVLRPKSCGGPVVDLAGNVVGINIARADRIASYLLPSEEIQPFVERVINENTTDENEE